MERLSSRCAPRPVDTNCVSHSRRYHGRCEVTRPRCVCLLGRQLLRQLGLTAPRGRTTWRTPRRKIPCGCTTSLYSPPPASRGRTAASGNLGPVDHLSAAAGAAGRRLRVSGAPILIRHGMGVDTASFAAACVPHAQSYEGPLGVAAVWVVFGAVLRQARGGHGCIGPFQQTPRRRCSLGGAAWDIRADDEEGSRAGGAIGATAGEGGAVGVRRVVNASRHSPKPPRPGVRTGGP